MEKLIAAILANESLPFERGDLENLSETHLKAILAPFERIGTLEQELEDATENDDEDGDEDGEGDGSDEDGDEDGDGDDEPVPAWAQALISEQGKLSKTVGELVTQGEDAAEAGRTAQIDAMLASGSPFSKTELEAFSAEQLELLASKHVQAADFTGQGGIVAQQDEAAVFEIELPAAF